MKYIPTLESNRNFQEKINYLNQTKSFDVINTNWLLDSLSKTTSLLSKQNCHTCQQVVGVSWYSIEGNLLCKKCFEDYRDRL